MSLTKKIKTVLRPFKNAVRNSRIYRAYGQEIDRNLICVISRNGAELAGNMLRLLLSIRSIYGRQYRITVAAEEKAKEKIQSTLAYYELGDVEILRYGSVRHLKELERAGYLLTDTSLPRAFVKREGQVILNTWHGTPLKLMGNHSRSDRLRMDNVQRCLFMTDYLLFPNEYCFEVMTSSYAMQGLYAGSVLTEGYPRNAVFFDSDLREATRDKFKLEDKRVFAYLPTFRDHLQGARVQEQIAQMKEILDYLDANLAEEEILFVKLHYLVSSAIELGGYRHIRPFPEGIETYEFLNAVDCLITDYSSVFYDFANTRRKIIRFVFDEEEYEAARGMYEQPVPAPFPKVYSKDALLSEMRAGKDYDDAAFLSSFCGYDRSDAAERLVRHVFGKENVCESRSIQNTDGKNVLIYVGSLALNGITTSMMNLMQNTKDDGRHYAFAYVRKHLSEHPEYLDQLPQDRTIEIGNERQYTLKEALAIALFYKLGSKRKWVARNVDRYYQREYARFFTGMRADTVIQYTGYTKFITGLLEKAEGKTVIYAHNDMKKELSSKATLNRTALTEAYQNYDRVAACSDSAFQSVKEIGGRTDNLFLC